MRRGKGHGRRVCALPRWLPAVLPMKRPHIVRATAQRQLERCWLCERGGHMRCLGPLLGLEEAGRKSCAHQLQSIVCDCFVSSFVPRLAAISRCLWGFGARA